MSDLRAQVVEAMAQAYKSATYGPALQDDPDVWERCVEGAATALDAALDVLGERSEEWVFIADDEPYLRSFVDSLLAVLRAGKGSE